MFNLFAHAGHVHGIGQITDLDHCLPIIIGAGIMIALLAAVIVYLLITWQPKSFSQSKTAVKTVKKTTKK